MAERIPILVIDDDAGLRELLEYTLRLSGFEVYLAEDGKTGLEMAREKKPSLILLDVKMEGMDGLEVLSELKYNKKTEDIPIFMLTAKSKLSDIDYAFEIGADDYITKPVKLMKLGGILKEKLAERTKRKGKDRRQRTEDGGQKAEDRGRGT